MSYHVIPHKKIIIIKGIFFACIAILTIRIFFLQVIYNQFFARAAQKNFLRTKKVPAPRGNIVDCHGQLLATNRTRFTVYWHGSGTRNLKEHHTNLLKEIAMLLNISFSHHQHRLIQRAQREGTQAFLATTIDFNLLCTIAELYDPENNIAIETSLTRHYPHGTLACHTLGYLQEPEKSMQLARAGLEKKLDTKLSGTVGSTTHITNARGKRLGIHDHEHVTAGKDFTLTLDLAIQRITDSLFRPGQAGACIVLDPCTGAVKALTSYPQFDPNIFLQPMSRQKWETLLKTHNPFLNRTIHATYPPASLFKLVTFTAGLEKNIISKQSVFTCTGSHMCGKRTYFCQRHWGHGTISSTTSLAVSCNIACYTIAEKLPIQDLAYYAQLYGLGQKSNFLLGEKQGLVPTPAWKQATQKESWWPGETLCVSIGQSYLLATPLQIATMIGAVLTGYRVRPRILAREPIQRTKLGIKRSTLHFLQSAMIQVVQKGTARTFKTLKDFIILAKTGTAQTVGLGTKKKGRTNQEHAWFAANFLTKKKNPLTLVVLVEHAGSSAPAKDIGYTFFKKFQNII